MKKVLSLFLSIIIVFSFSCVASADDLCFTIQTDGITSNITYTNKALRSFSKRGAEVEYDVRVADIDASKEIMYNALKNHLEYISLDVFDISYIIHTGEDPAENDLFLIFNDLFRNTPELFYVEGKCECKNGNIYFYYRMAQEEAQEAQRAIDKECRVILSHITPDMDDVQKALAVHDYFALNYIYNYAARYSQSEYPEAFAMDGLFIDKMAVCQGISLGYMYVLGLLGIESRFVPNNADLHAWNLVKINNNWYHVDVTHDLTQPDEVGMVLHNYFLLSDDAIILCDMHHSWDIETDAADTSYDNFFWKDVYNGIFYRDGFWYYATTDNVIVKCDVLSDEVSVVLPVTSGWRYTLNYGNVRMFMYGDRIYYNGPYYLYSANLDGSDIQEISPQLANSWTHILGIERNGKDITYILYTYSLDLGNILYGGIESFEYFKFDYTPDISDDVLVVTVLSNPDMELGRMFACVYDGDNNLVDILTPLQIMEESGYTISFTKPHSLEGKSGYIKVMIWDFIGRPLAESKNVYYQ